MRLSEQKRIAMRDKRVEYLVAYCKNKYRQRYTPELFDIYYAGYELARRRVMKGKEL